MIKKIILKMIKKYKDKKDWEQAKRYDCKLLLELNRYERKRKYN